MKTPFKLINLLVLTVLLTTFGCSNDDDNTVAKDNYPTNGLKLYYKLDNNTVDSGPNNYNATGTSIVYTRDRNNIASSVATFNGVDAFIAIPDAARFQPLTSSTLSFWIKTDQQSRFDLFDQRTGSFDSDAHNFGVIVNANNPDELLYNYPNYNSEGETSYALRSVTISDGVWHHVVLIKDTENELMKLYLDNIETSSTTLSLDVEFMVNGTLLLGKNYADLSYFEGSIDDIFVYDRALSTNEVSTLFNYVE